MMKLLPFKSCFIVIVDLIYCYEILILALYFFQAYPQEKVGVFVRRGKGGPFTVVEYSEIDPSMASEINQETGRLRFCWSNV